MIHIYGGFKMSGCIDVCDFRVFVSEMFLELPIEVAAIEVHIPSLMCILGCYKSHVKHKRTRGVKFSQTQRRHKLKTRAQRTISTSNSPLHPGATRAPVCPTLDVSQSRSHQERGGVVVY